MTSVTVRQTVVCLLLLICGSAEGLLARTWTDASGKYTVEAEFVARKQGKVYLKRQDGKVINLPLSKLSQADQDFVLGIGKEPAAAPAPQAVFEPGPDDPRQVATLKAIGCIVYGREGNAQTVIFSDKQSTDENLKHLVGLKNVEVITMRGPDITDAGLASLANLPTLHTLNIYDSEISGVGLARLAASKQLKALELAGSTITDEGIANVVHFPELERLKLTGTIVTSECGPSLAGLPKLGYLWLERTDVDDAILKHLGGLQQLKELSLAGTKVDGSALADLAGAKSLTDLSLGGCPIKEMHFAALHRFTQLKKLHLLQVEASQQAWIELFQALPDCRIAKPPE